MDSPDVLFVFQTVAMYIKTVRFRVVAITLTRVVVAMWRDVDVESTDP